MSERGDRLFDAMLNLFLVKELCWDGAHGHLKRALSEFFPDPAPQTGSVIGADYVEAKAEPVYRTVEDVLAAMEQTYYVTAPLRRLLSEILPRYRPEPKLDPRAIGAEASKRYFGDENRPTIQTVVEETIRKALKEVQK
jgi:hypothetical protein